MGPKSTNNFKLSIFGAKGGARGVGSAEEALAVELLILAASGEKKSDTPSAPLGETWAADFVVDLVICG